MRYLLDELMAYEEGFSDILMADRAADRHETFMGANPSTTPVPVSRQDFEALELKLLETVKHAFTPHSFLRSVPPRVAPLQSGGYFTPISEGEHVLLPFVEFIQLNERF